MKSYLNLLFALLTMYHPFEETSMGGSHRHFSKSVLPFAITLLMVISGRAAGAGLTLSHSSMVLNTVQGVKNYTSQSLGVSAATLTSYTVSLSTSTGGNWLSISPGTGILNTVMNPYLIVAADATGLGPGYYFGQVTVTASGATLTVFVVLAVDIATRAGIVGIIASPSSVSLTATPNTSATANVILTTTSSSALSYSLTSATIPLGGHWLGGAGTSLSVSSTSSSTVEIVANATGLSAGTYYAVVQVWPSNGAAGTTIPVTFTVTASGTGNITVTANNAAGPPSLAFAYVTGGATPAVQTLQILSTSGSAPVAFTVSSSASWLSAGVSSGNSLNTPVDNPGLPISVNPSGLTASPTPYSAAITITPTGGTVVTVPVTLTVQPAPSVTVSPTTLTFAYQMGAANPSPATINVSGGGQALGFAVQVTSGSSWLSVAPATGTTPVTGTIALTVTANPKDAGLTATTYIGSILVTGRDTAINSTSIMVTLSVTAPLPAIAKIVNAASGAEGVIVPGEIVAIFAPAGGNNPIGPATAVGLTLDQDGKVSTSLGGVQVLFNGTPAPLTYVSAAQVNAVVPYEIRGVLSSTVWVKFQGQSSQQLSLQTAVAAPGIFTANGSGTGPGAIANGDGSTNSPSNPSPKGGIVVLYVTGEGYTSPIAVTGKVTTISSTGPLTPQPLVPMGITIDGQPADVTFWGEAPGFVAGVMQVNVRIPANVRSGDLPMIVSIGGNSSQSGVTVSVQ